MIHEIVSLIVSAGRDPHEFATTLVRHCIRTGESVAPAGVERYARRWLKTGRI